MFNTKVENNQGLRFHRLLLKRERQTVFFSEYQVLDNYGIKLSN